MGRPPGAVFQVAALIMGKSKQGYYAVRTGHQSGIYMTWAECEAQVKGYPNAVFKKFATQQDAAAFVAGKSANSTSKAPVTSDNSSRPPELLGRDRPLVVWCDGCCLSNGRTKAQAGYGVFWDDNSPLNIAARLPGHSQTNNRAELMAVIRALETCPDPNARLEIKTDSRYVISAMVSWVPSWKKRGWKTVNDKPVQNKDLIIRLLRLLRQRRIPAKLVHVPGHAGIHGNEMADRLANHGATLAEEASDSEEPDDEESDLLPSLPTIADEEQRYAKREVRGGEGVSSALGRHDGDLGFEIDPSDLLTEEELRELETKDST